MRSPVAGIVFDSRVFTERAVIRPAEPILFIVPSDRPVEIIAQVAPAHIDEVRRGQSSTLRFTTFEQRLTPEIFGTVKQVAPDTIRDPDSGTAWYEIIVEPDANQTVLNGLEMRPGMPVEVFLNTEKRTALDYLVRPLSDYFRRAFRET